MSDISFGMHRSVFSDREVAKNTDWTARRTFIFSILVCGTFWGSLCFALLKLF